MPKKSDGQSVQLIADAAYQKDQFIAQDGWFGEVMNTCAVGEQFTLDIAQTEKKVRLPAGTAAGVGAADTWLYFNGTVWAAASAVGYHRVGRVTKSRDGNNIVYFVQQPQSPPA